jgi:hypothetical protein
MANKHSDKISLMLSLVNARTPEPLKNMNYMRMTMLILSLKYLGINDIPEEIFKKIYEFMEPFVEVKLLMYKQMSCEPVIMIKKCRFSCGSKTCMTIRNGARSYNSIDASNEIVNVFFKHDGRYVVIDTADHLMRVIDNKLTVIAKLRDVFNSAPWGEKFYTGTEFMPIETIRPIKSYEAVIKYDDIFDKWRFLHPN